MSPSKSRTYTTWYSMHMNHFGEVCQEWSDYQTFREDMGEKPVGVSLCRRKLSEPYSKANCYWGRRNHTGRRTVLLNGVCLTEWSRRIGVSQQQLSRVRAARGLSGLQTYIAEKLK